MPSVFPANRTINEASAGDPSAATDRLQLLSGLPLLAISKDAENLAAKILAGHMMPEKAAADALHVAVAAPSAANSMVEYIGQNGMQHLCIDNMS